ncbi:tetratricopeptide repeat protein [Flavobacterium johnsoniae]|uniref:Uncharacterized protein n=1 Tax=Flavobacterium johnsoniae TaxID=986 RepID=A0A1J7BPW0_FLAJO|nr:tetratricopeptide repeat protein [Flavobacterium johnsoniae]OIV40731.1 hypothetical protein BKM63_17895 [Flavobacterium johnsoniae]
MKNVLKWALFSLLMFGCQGDDYYNLGVYEAKSENYEKSIYYFSKAIDENPNDNEAYFSRAYSQQKIGGKERNVILDYSKSLELNPNDFEAHNNRGAAYMKIKDYKNALSDYEKTIELNPNYSLAFYNMGNLFVLINDKKNACENYNKALELGYKAEDIKLKIMANCK